MSAEPTVNSTPAAASPEAAVEQETFAAPAGPIRSLSDPRAVQIMATEHWSLLASRSLAYNESFIRGGMFLTFLSMSFVGLALLAQALSFSDQFLILTAVVLAFDWVIGVLTYVRMSGAAADDLRSVHGMARMRHGYTEIAPMVEPYLTSPTHDDISSVITAYGPPSTSVLGDLLYGLSTSQGMIGLIAAMVGGVLVSVVALLGDAGGGVALALGVVAMLIELVLMIVLTFRAAARHQALLVVRFPAPARQSETPVEEPPVVE